jgi:hypothetical protein
VLFNIDAELCFHFTRDSLGNLTELHKGTPQFIGAKLAIQ